MPYYLSILLIISACFFWGLVFVIPSFIINFTPLEIALGRYFSYGLLSILLMIFQWKELSNFFSRKHLKIWLFAACLTLVANFGYYIFLIIGIRYSSATAITLTLGLGPITIALFGGKVRGELVKTLLFSSFLIFIGLVLVNTEAIIKDFNQMSIVKYSFGTMCGFISLGGWTWFVLKNLEFLENHPEIKAHIWTTIIGITTFVLSILGFTLMFIFSDKTETDKFFVLNDELARYMFCVLILGVFSSGTALFLWNRASLYIPISLSGQLTIFETLFGLMFVFVTKQHLPSKLEFFGIFSMLIGITLCIRLLGKPLAILSDVEQT